MIREGCVNVRAIRRNLFVICPVPARGRLPVSMVNMQTKKMLNKAMQPTALRARG